MNVMYLIWRPLCVMYPVSILSPSGRVIVIGVVCCVAGLFAR